MKTLLKLTCAIFAFTLLFTACSKDDDDSAPRVAKEITSAELLKYKIVEEFVAKPNYQPQFGEHPILFVTYFSKENETNKVSMACFNNISSDMSIDNISYDAKTGITMVKTHLGFYELTRNENDNIILKGKLNITDGVDFKDYWNSNHVQLIYLENTIQPEEPEKFLLGIAKSTYSATVGNTTAYYEFDNEINWMYTIGGYPTTYPWTYRLLAKTIGKGKDNGTAKYDNLFVEIPSGNGWKGSKKDVALLLVHTWNSNKETVGPIGIYEKHTWK